MPAGHEETPCAMVGCEILCTGRTCSSRCRSALWKVETDYKDRRRVRNASHRRSGASLTRYAVVQIKGSVIEILGFDLGKSRKAVERAFGVEAHPDLAVVAERHLPAVA